jgi:F-box and WD-40 domain protein 1/11
MSSDPSTRWNLDEHPQLSLPHPDHPGDGHTDVVYAVHLQGDYLVSVSADHTARVWDLRTQRLLYQPLVGHTGSVTAVQFDTSAHDDEIITGGIDGNVMIWRFSTGEAIKIIIEAHDGTVLSLHFDHKYLVTGGKDKKIKLWNRRSMDVDHADVPQFAVKPTEGDKYQEYSLLATLDGHDAAVNAVRLRKDVLVSGSGDSDICIWSLQTGKILQKVSIHQRGIACLQYNGRFIVSGSTDETVKIYDIDQKMEIACLKGHTNLVRSVQAVFDRNGQVETIISGSYDGLIRIWQQVPGSREWRLQHQVHLNDFQALGDRRGDKDADRFSNRIFSIDLDKNRLVCSGQGPMIRVWNLRLSYE